MQTYYLPHRKREYKQLKKYENGKYHRIKSISI